MNKWKRILVCVMILVIFGMGYYIYYLNTKINNSDKNTYNYAFSELVNYSNNIEGYLAKAMISKSAAHSSETLTKIWAESNLAIGCVEIIPFDEEGSKQTIKFLNQIGDYTYTLAESAVKGNDLSDDDLENLEMLYKYAVSLKDILNEMEIELNNGTISWKNLGKKLDLGNIDELNVFANIESNFDDYEGLIYDGAYSDYVEKNEKLGLVGDEISKDEAKEKIKDIFGEDNIQSIEYETELESGDIDSYSFDVKINDIEMDILVSKKGGWLVEIDGNKEVKEVKISTEEAIEYGKSFLNSVKYSGMKETYYMLQENILTINYAYEDSGVVVYPDLIKVKVAMDDGEILGLEAKGYLNSHTERVDLEAQISEDEAMQSLNDKLEIQSTKLAIIPIKNTEEEVFCYEFQVSMENRKFLVYVNAKTGEEEEILLLVESDSGTLTI